MSRARLEGSGVKVVARVRDLLVPGMDHTQRSWGSSSLREITYMWKKTLVGGFNPSEKYESQLG